MSLAARIGRAIFWSQAGRLAEAAILFLFSLMLARVLGPSSYGLYALGMSLAGVFAFLTLLGLGPETLGRFLPELTANGRRGRAARLLRALLAIRAVAIILAACLFFAFRNAILARFHFPLILESFAAVLLVFAARSVLDLLTYFFSGLLELRRVALAKLVAAAVAPLVFLGFLISGHAGATAAWVSVAAGSLAGILILGAPLLAERSPAFDHEQLPIRRILAFGMFTWVTNFFVYVLGDSTDVLLLGWLVPDRAAIGHYTVGAKVVFSITGLLLGWAPLVNVASLSESFQRKGAAGLVRALEAEWKFVALSVIAPLLFLLRYARAVVTLLFSPAYAGSVPVTQILCALVACAGVFGMSIHGGVLYTFNRERLACAAFGLAATFNIVSEIVLVRRIGMEGAAWATGLSFVLLAMICAIAARLCLPFRFPATFLGKVAAAVVVALAATVWLRPVSIAGLAGAAALYTAAFVASLALLKPLSASDSASLHRINNALGCCAERFFTAAYAAAGER